MCVIKQVFQALNETHDLFSQCSSSIMMLFLAKGSNNINQSLGLFWFVWSYSKQE